MIIGIAVGCVLVILIGVISIKKFVLKR
jgi:hypothetical protein